MAEKFVFEQAMKKLEEIVKKLEQGEVPLDESLKLFEQGSKLLMQCGKALDTAEQKLSMLVKTDDGPEEVPFSVIE